MFASGRKTAAASQYLQVQLCGDGIKPSGDFRDADLNGCCKGKRHDPEMLEDKKAGHHGVDSSS